MSSKIAKQINDQNRFFSSRRGAVLDACETLKARVLEGRLKWALAKAIESADPLEITRALISTGDASQALTVVEDQLGGLEAPLVRSEWLSEKVRALILLSLWDEALTVSQELLTLEPNLLSKMEIHQLRSLCFYETGDFVRAEQEIENTLTLGELFEGSNLPLYAKLLKAKIQARSSTKLARVTLEGAWRKLSSQESSELLVALLRTEIEILRQEKRPTSPIASACYLLTNHFGDHHFKAFAALDLMMSEGTTIPQLIWETEKRSEIFLKLFDSRIQGTSIETYRNHQLVEHPPTIIAPIKMIIIPEYQIIAQMEPFRISICHRPQMVRALTVLKDGPLPTEKFFEEVWERRGFSEHLHKGNVKVLLSQIRKELGLTIRQNKGLIEVPDALIL